MRLVEFISSHGEAILAEAAVYARTLPPLAHETDATLRDHFPRILEAIVADLRQRQSSADSRAKGIGQAPVDEDAPDTAAQTHGRLRAKDGLQTVQLVAEYRALRASVLRLWTQHGAAHASIDDVIRFNEAIDQAIAESVEYYSAEMDQLRNVFLGVLGHDLRGPLNAVLLTSELISKLSSEPAISRHLGVLIRSGRRMSALLDTLLHYNRSALGHGIAVHRARVDLGHECAAELELLRAALPEAVLTLACEGDLVGEVDASSVREALGNLVHNAVTYGDAGAIDLRLAGTPDTLVLTVANTGPEIPADRIARMFAPLDRAGQDDRGNRTNLGLGLFIVQKIAQAHDGRVECRSSPRRTVFELTLPRRAPGDPSTA
jgi:signal transduction histidine kinase